MKNSNFAKEQHKSLRIVDAAKELNLSISTVSRALSGKGRVSPATRERVITWARRNSWLPSSLSHSLLYGRSGNIVVFLPSLPDDEFAPFFHQYVLGVCEIADASNYDVLLLNTFGNDTTRLEELLQKNKIDGAISCNREPDIFFDLLLEHNIPCVILGERNHKGTIQIDYNTSATSTDLTSILLDNGLKRIAYLGGARDHIVNQHRQRGFFEAFRAKNAQYNPGLVFNGLESQAQVEQAILKLLERDVEGIIAGDDVICSRAVAVLHWLGIKIPSEIQIASCYHSFLMDIQSPQITCVLTTAKKLSNHASSLLFALMEGRETPQKTVVEHEIIIRGSTSKSTAP